MNDERFAVLAKFGKTIEQLNELSQEFKDTLSRGKSSFPPVGSVVVESGTIHVNTLGYKFRSMEKVVLSDDKTLFLELSFVIGEGDEEELIVSCYLSTGGTVFAEPTYDNKICEFNNTYSTEDILMLVANALIDSSLLNPSHTQSA